MEGVLRMRGQCISCRVRQPPFTWQEATMLLGFDLPRTNHSYYMNQRSGSHGHICSSVSCMFQPSHKSSAMFWFLCMDANWKPLLISLVRGRRLKFHLSSRPVSTNKNTEITTVFVKQFKCQSWGFLKCFCAALRHPQTSWHESVLSWSQLYTTHHH